MLKITKIFSGHHDFGMCLLGIKLRPSSKWKRKNCFCMNLELRTIKIKIKAMKNLAHINIICCSCSSVTPTWSVVKCILHRINFHSIIILGIRSYKRTENGFFFLNRKKLCIYTYLCIFPFSHSNK